MVDRGQYQPVSWAFFALVGTSDSFHDRELNQVSSNIRYSTLMTLHLCLFRIAIDPIFLPPPIPNSKRHQIPDALDNKYELVFNERDDAASLKNLPIDDTMHDII